MQLLEREKIPYVLLLFVFKEAKTVQPYKIKEALTNKLYDCFTEAALNFLPLVFIFNYNYIHHCLD